MDGGGILSDGEDLRNKPLPSYTKIVNSLEDTSMTCRAQDKEIGEFFWYRYLLLFNNVNYNASLHVGSCPLSDP